MPSSTKTILLFCLLIFLSPGLAFANEVDVNFIVDKIRKSDCSVDPVFFSEEFSSAMDRLNEINPKLVSYIRSQTYLRNFNLTCDVSRDEGSSIYFAEWNQTIHLYKDSSTTARTVANFFHEFLHFVGIKIDYDYHNQPDITDFIEVDYVYACHFVVYPQMFDHLKIDASRKQSALSKCKLAEIE